LVIPVAGKQKSGKEGTSKSPRSAVKINSAVTNIGKGADAFSLHTNDMSKKPSKLFVPVASRFDSPGGSPSHSGGGFSTSGGGFAKQTSEGKVALTVAHDGMIASKSNDNLKPSPILDNLHPVVVSKKTIGISSISSASCMVLTYVM